MPQFKFFDKNNNLETTAQTNPDGETWPLLIEEYSVNNVGDLWNRTPHRIMASKTGYVSEETTVHMVESKFIIIELSKPQTPKKSSGGGGGGGIGFVPVNKPPVLNAIQDQTVVAETLFTLAATATDPENNTLTFSDDTELFDISSETGIISFVPTTEDIGEYEITISVIDGKGGQDSEAFRVTVETPVVVIVEEVAGEAGPTGFITFNPANLKIIAAVLGAALAGIFGIKGYQFYMKRKYDPHYVKQKYGLSESGSTELEPEVFKEKKNK